MIFYISQVDSYLPYLKFFDFLCENAFNRIISTESASQNLGMLKQLIDLILLITQQAIFFNVSFISYLAPHLKTNAPRSSEQLPIYDIILESPHLNSFIKSILTNYRYVLKRPEFYDFVSAFIDSYVLSLTVGPVSEQLVGTITLLIEKFCHSINEIRFYFEFHQLAKHLVKSNLKSKTGNIFVLLLFVLLY